jgi:hypothetical protein
MLHQQPNYQAALMDFREARLRAALQEVLGRVTGKSSALLSYEDVAHKLGLTAGIERGVQAIPLNAHVLPARPRSAGRLRRTAGHPSGPS